MILGALARRTLQLHAVPVVLLALGLPEEPRAHEKAAREGVAVIVHATNPISDLSAADLRKILLGDDTRWPDNERITILLPRPGSEDRKVVLRVLLRMTDGDFVRHWISRVFQGEATSGPMTVASPASMLRLVAGVPKAIGFLDVGDVPAVGGGIKVLRVAGKAIDEEGYPLRR